MKNTEILHAQNRHPFMNNQMVMNPQFKLRNSISVMTMHQGLPQRSRSVYVLTVENQGTQKHVKDKFPVQSYLNRPFD